MAATSINEEFSFGHSVATLEQEIRELENLLAAKKREVIRIMRKKIRNV